MQSHAVIVFFVMSGFVIRYVTTTKERDAANYFLNRAARMYSVVVPALVVTLALDFAVAAMATPSAISLKYILNSATHAGLGLLFLNQVWGHDVAVGSNGPYWSLGYEVPYYLAFGAFLFAKGWWRWLLPAVVMGVFGPRVFLLSGLWLMGVAAFDICASGRIGRRLGWILLLGASAVWAGYYIAVVTRLVPSSVVPLYWHKFEIISDYFIALLFASQIVGFNAVAEHFTVVTERAGKVIRWIAGATFSVYLFHMPLVHFFTAGLHFKLGNLWFAAIFSVGIFAVTFLFAEISERRKDVVRGWLRQALAVVANKRPVTGGAYLKDGAD